MLELTLLINFGDKMTDWNLVMHLPQLNVQYWVYQFSGVKALLIYKLCEKEQRIVLAIQPMLRCAKNQMSLLDDIELRVLQE